MTKSDDDQMQNTEKNLDLPQLDDEQEAAKQNANSDSALNNDADDCQDEDLAAVYDVPVKVSAVLGHANMRVNQLLKLGRGAVVELDRKVGEAIDIYVNNRLVARGEVVVVEENLGITMTEIIRSERSQSQK